jgi:nicotinate-nucleotide adenylyltransferase
MRIGLFGGTFDPIHIGHLKAAAEVQETFALNKIMFIPSALPPHKTTDGVTKAESRIEMTRLAVSDHPDFTVSNIELERTGISYTIDTVRYLMSTMGEATSFYFILGLDAFFEIETWKSYKTLFRLIPFIVMTRPFNEHQKESDVEKKIDLYIKSKISQGYRHNALKSCFIHDDNQTISIFNVSPMEISSTEIRNLIQKGMPFQSLVPEKVESYIKSKGLYT